MYWVGVLTAGMTAFYVFRAWFMAFTGDYRGHAHPHESPLVMTGPLMILAVLSIFGGFINVPHILEPMFAEGPENQGLAWLSAGVGILGILLAYVFYVAKRGLADSFAKAMGGLYTLVYNKYFVDEAYDATVVEPLVEGSRTVLWRGVDAGLDRRHGQRRRASDRAASAPSCAWLNRATFAATRLGWCWVPSSCCSRSDSREACDDAAQRRHFPAAGRVPDHSGAAEGASHERIRVFSLVASLAIFVVSLGLIGPVWSSAPGKFAIETNQAWIQIAGHQLSRRLWTASACGW